MTTIFAPHKPDATRLAEVVAEMQKLGSPTIRAVWGGDHWQAIEGSHRLAAAATLGLPVEIEEVDEDAVIEHDFQDWVDDDGTPITRAPAREIVARLGGARQWTAAYDERNDSIVRVA